MKREQEWMRGSEQRKSENRGGRVKRGSGRFRHETVIGAHFMDWK